MRKRSSCVSSSGAFSVPLVCGSPCALWAAAPPVGHRYCSGLTNPNSASSPRSRMTAGWKERAGRHQTNDFVKYAPVRIHVVFKITINSLFRYILLSYLVCQGRHVFWAVVVHRHPPQSRGFYHFPTGASIIPGVWAAGEFTACAGQGQLAAAAAAAWVYGRWHCQAQLAQTLSHRLTRLPVQLGLLWEREGRDTPLHRNNSCSSIHTLVWGFLKWEKLCSLNFSFD